MTVITIGATILLISGLGAVFLANRPGANSHKQAKILLFALYFWILAFMQLILVAIGYSVLAR